uniref:Uncharacterized protein n=1 Tax=Tetranychus urticae TaxID=32264 RepID=T1K885_TETUR
MVINKSVNYITFTFVLLFLVLIFFWCRVIQQFMLSKLSYLGSPQSLVLCILVLLKFGIHFTRCELISSRFYDQCSLIIRLHGLNQIQCLIMML